MKPTYISLFQKRVLPKHRRLLLGLLLAPLSLSYAHTITLDDAVNQVKDNASGKIISAKTETTNDGEYHIIRVLTSEGRVIPIKINAQKHEHK